MFPLERVLLWHWAVQLLRILFVAWLFSSLWALGWLVNRLLELTSEEAPDRRLIEVALGFGVYSAIVRSLGAIGLASREVVLSILLVSTLSLLFPRRKGPLRIPRLERPSWKTGVLAGLALIPLPMALAPAVSYDALVYHLRFPEMTLWSGFWTIDPFNSPSAFPAATETVYLAALAVDSSGICAQLCHYGFFLLTLAALATLARRIAAGSSGVSAALLFAALPAATIVAGWSWSDMPLCFALLASGLALAGGRFAASLALLGLAASIKYSGLALGLPIAVAVAVAAIRRRRFRELAVGALLAAAIAGPWYAANWIRTGNPVFPLLPRLFGGSSETARRLVDWNASARGHGSWWGYVSRPATVDSDVGGIGFLVLFAVALVLGLRGLRRRVVVGLLLAGLAALFPFTPSARILLPSLAGACLLAGLALEDGTVGRSAIWSGAILVLLAARGGALAAAHNALFFNPLPCALGIESERDYTARNFPAVSLYARADATLPEDARVLAFGERRFFRFPRPTFASSAVDPPAISGFLRRAPDPPEVFRRLSRVRITHLLVSLDALRQSGADRTWLRGLTPSEFALLERVVQSCRVVDRSGPLLLLEVPRPGPPRSIPRSASPASPTPRPGG